MAITNMLAKNLDVGDPTIENITHRTRQHKTKQATGDGSARLVFIDHIGRGMKRMGKTV